MSEKEIRKRIQKLPIFEGVEDITYNSIIGQLYRTGSGMKREWVTKLTLTDMPEERCVTFYWYSKDFNEDGMFKLPYWSIEESKNRRKVR